MISELWSREPSWIKRIGGAVALWATICGAGVFAGMGPRPLLLAGVTGALSVVSWLTTDSIGHAEPADWKIAQELLRRSRGGDARVVTLEHVITDSRTSAESRLRLHHLLSDLADERLLSLHGVDRESDPAGARAALGPALDDFITDVDPGGTALSTSRMSSLLHGIESL
jgi:hypothetical protein